MAAFVDGTSVLHWHGDTFDLPDGAVLLASSDQYLHQAFSWEKHVLALQFHIETTWCGLERWLIGHAGEIAGTPGSSACWRCELKPLVMPGTLLNADGKP